MLLDFYSPDCYLSKLGRESHRFSFVTFCTVNGPEFGRLFSACQQAQGGLCSQGPQPCGGQTGRRAFQKINRHLVQIRAFLSLVLGSQAAPRSSLQEGGVPGCSRGGGLQTGPATWVSLSRAFQPRSLAQGPATGSAEPHHQWSSLPWSGVSRGRGCR